MFFVVVVVVVDDLGYSNVGTGCVVGVAWVVPAPRNPIRFAVTGCGLFCELDTACSLRLSVRERPGLASTTSALDGEGLGPFSR